ncbi:N-acetylmuramoyl-L-alanine amidase [Actinoplanes missouriensis]|uniref:N-acetylmuramoyl-L-alanine amidase n=1 Tax=Actinoplanes missouriensis TaxID=1866 RepID=UPI0033FC6D6B
MNRRLAIGVGAAAAVLAAGGGVAVLAWPDGGDAGAPVAAEQVTVLPPDPSAAPPKIKTAFNTVDIAAPAGGGDAELPERETKRFSMVGVSWSDPAAVPKGDIQVKTRSVAGKWSAWKTLERDSEGPDGAEGTNPGLRGGTVPLWAGPSDGVAARVVGGGSGLPAGLRLDLTDPGEESGGQGGGVAVTESPAAGTTTEPTQDPTGEPTVDPTTTEPEAEPTTGATTTTPAAVPTTTSAPVSTTTPAPATTTTTTKATTAPAATSAKPSSAGVTANAVPTSTTPVKAQFPSYVSRSSWGADETIVGSISVASEVRVLWVHHTGFGDNKYSCADSAAIVRSIQLNDVKGKQFSDIGYNYLVDKCGKLFEGRKGGVENAVIGAHAKGFNTNYAGIAVIGNFETDLVSNAAIEKTLAQVAAARLGKYNYSPTSTVTVAAGSDNDKFKLGDKVTLNRIAGHKDGDATACPGKNLYPRLPAIRALASEQITGLALSRITGVTKQGSVYYTKKTATLSWSVTTPTAKIARFEIYVDNKKVASPVSSARSATVTLAAGKHSVIVRGVHTAGSTAQFGVTVIGDPTAPTWTAGMAVNLRPGTYNATSVPVTLTLSAKDNAAFAGFTVTKPRAATLGASAKSWNVNVKPGTTTYAVTARDVAGNTRTAQIGRKLAIVPETSAKKTGAWTTVKNKAHLSGKALSASAKGRKLTWSFTGRTAALAFMKTPKSGKVAIYVDGKKVSTLDLKSAKNAYRQAVWTRNLASGKHKIMIEVLGTKGRPTVISDGLVVGN